ncbi:hypothetical protein LINPERPRIM_LOCUS25737 [Linum perenne]
MDANFHGLLDVQVDLINKELCGFLISSYDPTTRTFLFPNGEVLTVEPSDVTRVYGLTAHKSIEECQDGHAFSRMYILHSLGTLLVPGNSWKISLNYAKYLNEDFSLIGQLNWGKYVVDTLLLGLDEIQTKLSYPSGDFNFLVVSFKEYRYGNVMPQV